LFPDFCPILYSNIFIDLDSAATARMSIFPVSLRPGNLVTLVGLDIVVVRTEVRAAFLKLAAFVLKRLSCFIETDATNAGRTTVIMATCVRFQLYIHDAGFHFGSPPIQLPFLPGAGCHAFTARESGTGRHVFSILNMLTRDCAA